MLAVFCTILVIGFAFDNNPSPILTQHAQNPQEMQCFTSKWLKKQEFYYLQKKNYLNYAKTVDIYS